MKATRDLSVSENELLKSYATMHSAYHFKDGFCGGTIYNKVIIIWDEDHDERVFIAIDELRKRNFNPVMVHEHEGGITCWTKPNDSTRWTNSIDVDVQEMVSCSEEHLCEMCDMYFDNIYQNTYEEKYGDVDIDDDKNIAFIDELMKEFWSGREGTTEHIATFPDVWGVECNRLGENDYKILQEIIAN